MVSRVSESSFLLSAAFYPVSVGSSDSTAGTDLSIYKYIHVSVECLHLQQYK